MSFLEINSLRKVFGDTVAVDDVSLTVEEGDFITVVGPSGCGKTTTLLNVAGLQAPTSGSIELKGRDLTDLPAYKRDIGVVFQDYALFPHKTVAENIAFGLKMRGESQSKRDEVVEEMLSMIDLEGYEDVYPHQCSGGEQQRVAVARALAFDPDLVLMDEPLSNLDKKLRQSLRTELKRIQRETGVTTIYVTHNQTEALSMGDKIAVMNNGNLEQFADPKLAYEKPASPFVANFLGQSSRIDGTLRTDSAPHVQLENGAILEVDVREGFDDGDAVAVFLRNELVSVTENQPADVNAFTGRVAEVDYQGRDVIYYVTVPDLDVTVQVSGDGRGTVYEAGKKVWLSIAPEDVIYTASEGRTGDQKHAAVQTSVGAQ
ncbi:ABC transporter ATP-binding protein [Halobacteria archaeon AArc-curdl1]|uniref:Molybdate/tungstate import ATP-binding protein WtpC n=1 Tax=Natronosalvus hydrolyticus TaxID=2979988 RepID=A0AAP3E9M9_9EURY|nr:ABC transporter ATP-binding protein [Halobacteria archaeon AArc-curdl1]